MGIVVFTARRSFMPEHADGQEVALEVDFQDAIRRPDVHKYTHRASDGKMETLFERLDILWELELAPVSGDRDARVREFLDSTASGEAFQIWIYGNEAAPITVKRKDSGYGKQPFTRTDRAETDSFVMRMTVLEQ